LTQTNKMKALLVKSDSQEEMKFISDLLKKLGVFAKELDIEEIEDYGLGILIKEADRSKKVNRETIIKKLKTK